MSVFTKVFQKLYPAWHNLPTKDTPATAEAFENYDAAIINIENHLEGTTAIFPITATGGMTQPVGVDGNGRLVTLPGGAGDDITCETLVVGSLRDDTTLGRHSTARGTYNEASGIDSHAEGYGARALGETAHAEGSNTIASGDFSHAEGNMSKAYGQHSHAEGWQTTAGSATNSSLGAYSHAEGCNTTTLSTGDHAEGYGTTASGGSSHAEGYETTASGADAHAQGLQSVASGNFSTAAGEYVNAGYEAQTAIGKFNDNQSDSLFEVGNGSSTSNRSNAFRVKSNGDAIAGGEVIDGQGNKLATISKLYDYLGYPYIPVIHTPDPILFSDICGKRVREYDIPLTANTPYEATFSTTYRVYDIDDIRGYILVNDATQTFAEKIYPINVDCGDMKSYVIIENTSDGTTITSTVKIHIESTIARTIQYCAYIRYSGDTSTASSGGGLPTVPTTGD